MTFIQLNLTDEEKNLIETIKFMQKLKSKQAAVSWILKNYEGQMQ